VLEVRAALIRQLRLANRRETEEPAVEPVPDSLADDAEFDRLLRGQLLRRATMTDLPHDLDEQSKRSWADALMQLCARGCGATATHRS
jgi:hypothetical protein